ncbi:hypothetical protein BDR03DRAFT_851895, partial [Suillus americanus]
TQTLILINRRLSKNKWHTISINSPNIMAIKIAGQFGKVHVYNVYNPCDHNNVLRFMERHMNTEPS